MASKKLEQLLLDRTKPKQPVSKRGDVNLPLEGATEAVKRRAKRPVDSFSKRMPWAGPPET